MKARWVKQKIHEELELAKETWTSQVAEVPMEIEVEGTMEDVEQVKSIMQESEEQATQILACIDGPPAHTAMMESYHGDLESAAMPQEDDWEHHEEQSADEGPASGDWDVPPPAMSSEERAREEARIHDMVNRIPSGATKTKPLVEPPEFGDRIKDLEKKPFWISGEFPTIFQNETGDPYNWYETEPDLNTWGPHIMRSKGWMAQAHMTFMYWWFNMVTRFKALSAKKWYVRDNPQSAGWTKDDLKEMGINQLAKRMVGYTASIPGSKASKAKLRRLILQMVKQLEIETRRGDVMNGAVGDGVGLGDIPCLFGTLTSQRYHWDGIIRIIAEVEGIVDHKSLSRSKRRQLVNKYPLFVAWYCAVRLELTLKSIVVPIFGASAYVAVFEWSPTGGMVHLHYILWKPGAPRFDIRAEHLQQHAEEMRKAKLLSAGPQICRINDIVDFFARYVSEWNPNKGNQGEDIDAQPVPQDACSAACSDETDTEAHMPSDPTSCPPPPPSSEAPRRRQRKGTAKVIASDGPHAAAGHEGRCEHQAACRRGAPTIVERIAAATSGVEAEVHTASLSIDDMLSLLQTGTSDERHEYYKRAVRTEHIHDFHYPDPHGPPNPAQPCAKLLKGTLNMWYCANGYPRDLVCEPCEQSIAQDPLRTDLWRCHLCRNDPLMNSHMPAVSVGLQSNNDAQPVATKHQAEMYCCKYCAKHHKRLGTRSSLYDILDDLESKDANAKAKYGEEFEASKLGSKLHRAFMGEIGEEMCQAEVAHHANKSPEYLCSRPEKHVHLYKKALEINSAHKEEPAWAGCEDWEQWEDVEVVNPKKNKRLATKPNDLEVYERRIDLYVYERQGDDWVPATVTPHLPPRASPEEQVEHATVYEFFRLVQYHGGKSPWLSWHEAHCQPIVVMSPVVRLREDHNFAFGARWALVQNHAWRDRKHFIQMGEDDVKAHFRDWVDSDSCPWYVREQYYEDLHIFIKP